MAAHHGFHFSRKTLNISFRQDKTNVYALLRLILEKYIYSQFLSELDLALQLLFLKAKQNSIKILMACFGLYPVCIILDHKWQWIYLFENEIHNNKLRQKYGPNVWTKISHSTKNVQTAASFTHALKRLN